MDTTKAAIFLFVLVSLSVGTIYFFLWHCNINASRFYKTLGDEALHKTNRTKAIGRNIMCKVMAKFDEATLHVISRLQRIKVHVYGEITVFPDAGAFMSSCERRVPNLIIQYGVPRTATTLQFHTLCLMMIMVHEDEVQHVGCKFNEHPGSKYRVIKTHSMSERLLALTPPDSWVFLTSNGTTSSKKREKDLSMISKRNLTIPYVADLNLVLKRGHSVAYEYQSIFGVNDEQMTRIAEYLRFWDILRVCCGRQLSKQLRHILTSGTDNDPKGLAYPACEMYNISQVERFLMQSYIVRKFARVSAILKKVIGKPAIRDGILDGNYCERCNRKIKMHKSCL